MYGEFCGKEFISGGNEAGQLQIMGVVDQFQGKMDGETEFWTVKAYT